MDKKPNSGTADARAAAVTWPDAEVAGRLSPELGDNWLMLESPESPDACFLVLGDCFLTERSLFNSCNLAVSSENETGPACELSMGEASVTITI